MSVIAKHILTLTSCDLDVVLVLHAYHKLYIFSPSVLQICTLLKYADIQNYWLR